MTSEQIKEQISTASANVEQLTIKKLFRHLVPVMAILYFVSFLDRANIGIASLTMNESLGISAATYGLGAGIFFLGYFIFEVPSNIILAKVGARKWITRILVTWGLVSTCFAFVQNGNQMLTLRFLLGVAEAGFYPGIIYYISVWFPANQRAKATAGFFVCCPLAMAVGNSIGGLLLGLDGIAGLHGWQWLFLVEGIPAMLLGFASWKFLIDSPRDAKWLTKEEQDWLINELASEPKAEKTHVPFRAVFAKPSVWVYAAFYLAINCGFYAVTYFIPQIVKQMSGANAALTGIYSAIPFMVAVITVLVLGHYSSKAKRKRIFILIPLPICALSLIGSAYSSTYSFLLPLSLLFLALAVSGENGLIAPFWTFPQKEFSGTIGAAAIATINSIGNLGGFVGPTIFGIFVQRSGGSFHTSIICMSAFFFAALLIAALAPAFKDKDA